MGAINSGLNVLMDIVCLPFLGIAPIWAMLVISLVSGVLMVWIYGKTSNQTALHTLRNRVRGNLIAVKLFQDDISVVLKMQWRILKDTLLSFRYQLVPILVLIVPVLLIMIQLNLRFAIQPLKPGATTTITATLQGLSPVDEQITLEAPDGVVVETEAVRIEAKSEVSWRVRGVEPGRHQLTVRAGEHAEEKELVVGESWGKVSPLRTGKGFFDSLLWPGEPPIASQSPFETIAIEQAQALPLPLPLIGWHWHWMIHFLVFSILFGFAFKGVLGVEL